jgi:hypothetical protein
MKDEEGRGTCRSEKGERSRETMVDRRGSCGLE